MIAYEILVQTIADWKAGVRPTAPTPPVQMHEPPGQPEMFEEIESGVVDVGETEWSVEEEREAPVEEESEAEAAGWSEEEQDVY